MVRDTMMLVDPHGSCATRGSRRTIRPRSAGRGDPGQLRCFGWVGRHCSFASRQALTKSTNKTSWRQISRTAAEQTRQNYVSETGQLVLRRRWTFLCLDCGGESLLHFLCGPTEALGRLLVSSPLLWIGLLRHLSSQIHERAISSRPGTATNWPVLTTEF